MVMEPSSDPVDDARQLTAPDAALRRLQVARQGPKQPVSGHKWRRRIAYVILITYAVLMFTPFAWSVVTSFKTLPDSLNLSFIPQPFTLDAWRYALTELDPNVVVLFMNSLVIASIVTLT